MYMLRFPAITENKTLKNELIIFFFKGPQHLVTNYFYDSILQHRD